MRKRITEKLHRALSNGLYRSFSVPHLLLPIIASLAVLSGCASSSKPEIPSSVPELRPGTLAGYLPTAALPNSLKLLPPPPAANSADFAADEEIYRSTRALRDSPRWTQAMQDAVLHFPQAAESFSCALGAPITQEATPHLYMLIRRSLTDAGLSTYTAKSHYRRVRPFVAHGDTSCTPKDEAFLRKDGSYPSGHSALGWAWALILTEVAPERSNELLARGLSFSQSRVICGVHWQSDVIQGRIMGAAVVARLHGDPVFEAELEEARKEVAAARTKGMQPTRDCQAEAAALK